MRGFLLFVFSLTILGTFFLFPVSMLQKYKLDDVLSQRHLVIDKLN